MPTVPGRLLAGAAIFVIGLSACAAAGVSPASLGPSEPAEASSAPSIPNELPSFAADPSVSLPPEAGDAVAVIGGVEYTCDELLGDPGSGCNEALQASFARWAGNVGAYLEAEPVVMARQVLMPPLADGQVVLYGLVACSATEIASGEGMHTLEVASEFQTYVLDGRPGSDTGAIDDLFFEALRVLCRDVEIIDS